MTSPAIHFKTTHFPADSSEQPEQPEIPELVYPGQLLVSLSESEDTASTEVILDPGKNTKLSPQGDSISALCHGYPKVSLNGHTQRQIVHVRLTPLLVVTEDRMEAQITLYPPLPGQAAIDRPMLEELLQHARVIFGVDRELIEKSLLLLAQTGQPVMNFTVARGRAAINGKDAYLRAEVEVGPVPGKILGNGSIDFRERRMFVEVKKNQLIATKIPPTGGTAGMNLMGDILPAREGQDMLVKISDDTAYCENDGTVRATASGILSMVNLDTIRVSAKQRIDGDVDYSTGNIRSRNAVEITGSVLPNFMVSTRGNLLIGGDVRAATVNSHGNLVVKGGILGSEAQVRIQGDADIHYIERGLLICGGNVVLRSSAYYSTIQAGGNIHCPDKVKLVGGTIIAGGSLNAGQVGSYTAAPISIAVGTDPKRYRRYTELQDYYQQLIADLQNWYHHHGQASKKNNYILGIETDITRIERELNRLNLIPGTPEESLGNPEYFFSPAEIVIAGFWAAGSRIRIGNDNVVLAHNLSASKACMDKSNGGIIFVPL